MAATANFEPGWKQKPETQNWFITWSTAAQVLEPSIGCFPGRLAGSWNKSKAVGTPKSSIVFFMFRLPHLPSYEPPTQLSANCSCGPNGDHVLDCVIRSLAVRQPYTEYNQIILNKYEQTQNIKKASRKEGRGRELPMFSFSHVIQAVVMHSSMTEDQSSENLVVWKTSEA